MTFTPDTDETPVLFRFDHGEVTAIFPTIPGTNDPATMTCYAHIGQHGSCSVGWIRTTRPATEAEYADLKAELETAPFGYRLKVCRRIQPAHRAARMAELNR